jgi:hypothetical protein
LGRDEAVALSEEEIARNGADLKACVTELSTWLAGFDPYPRRWHPSREARVLELLDCMEGKGWRVVKFDVVVTGGATDSASH